MKNIIHFTILFLMTGFLSCNKAQEIPSDQAAKVIPKPEKKERVKKGVLLTKSASAVRDETLVGYHHDMPERYDGTRYGGFYTREQAEEIVEYARKRFIIIIPEIELPGHSIAALTAYPELGCTGGPYKVRTTWSVEEDELQSYFIRRIESFLDLNGRKLIGWDEILEGGLAPNATVMSWRGMNGGIEAARQGHDVIMTPVDVCEYMVFPRICALAEVAWSSKEKLDYSDFLTRLEPEYKRLELLDVNYRKPE